MTVTGYTFNDNEIAKLKTIFHTMTDGHASLATSALSDALSKARIKTAEPELSAQLKAMNVSDQLRFDDFLAIIGRQRERNPEEGLERVFALLDGDGDGHITQDELRNGLEEFGESVSDDDIRRMMQAADVDGDGKINYEEFVKILTPSKVNGQA